MCSESTQHIINGEDVILHQGELLLLNQKATQESYPADKQYCSTDYRGKQESGRACSRKNM